MYWANFLHFYQPYNQQADILERIVNESYRPLIAGFKKNRRAKATININGGLLELLDQFGYQDVIKEIKKLIQQKQIELTGSAMYHPFLPLLPKEEIRRQIQLNEKTLQKFFGKLWQKKGFFSPELAYSQNLAKIVGTMGYQWIIAEEIASPKKPDFEKIYRITSVPNLKIFFRDKRISILLLSAIIRSKKSFLIELNDDIKKNRYLLTVMDAETFGHHRPGLEKSLFEIYQIKKIKIVCLSDLLNYLPTNNQIEPRASTWSSEEQDFYLEKEKTHPFTLWQHPQNPIHQLQWQFTYFVINQVKKISKYESGYSKIRKKLDQALQSDQFWWASARPWWSLEMIEQGAWILRDVIFSKPNISTKVKKKADEYYRKILDIAFEWQRKGLIRQAYRQFFRTITKIPFKKRVSKSWYNLIILEFEDEMKKAIDNLEFEKAIKWRDAIYKLKSGNDIYDVLHVVDDLRQVRSLPSLKSFWEHYPEEFSSFARSHFKDFTKKSFLKNQPKIILKELKKSYQNPPVGFYPIGFNFSKDKKNIYLCELPSKNIKFIFRSDLNSPYSQLSLPKPGLYKKNGQCVYQYQTKKVKVIITRQSVLGKFLDFLKKEKKKFKIGILTKNKQWQLVYFKKSAQGLSVSFPYKKDMPFKFQIKLQS